MWVMNIMFCNKKEENQYFSQSDILTCSTSNLMKSYKTAEDYNVNIHDLYALPRQTELVVEDVDSSRSVYSPPVVPVAVRTARPDLVSTFLDGPA